MVESKKYLFQMAFTTFLACLLTQLIVHFLDLQYSYWALISTFIVIQSSYATTIERCLHRIVASFIGCAVAYGLYLLFPSSYILVLSTFLLLLFLSLVFAQANFFPYAMVIFAATCLFVIIGSHFESDSIKNVAASRFIDVFIGVMSASLCVILFFPRTKSDASEPKPFHISKVTLYNSILAFIAVIISIFSCVITKNPQPAITALVIMGREPVQSFHKTLLRVLGTLIGGIIGFLFVIAFHFSWVVMLLIASFTFAGFNYLSHQSKKHSYMWTMAGIAFALCIGGFGKYLDSYEGVELMLLGVLIGGVVVIVVVSIARFAHKYFTKRISLQ